MKKMSIKTFVLFFVGLFILTSCNDDFSWLDVHTTPRVEYAPNMYYSQAYESMTQITDEHAGDWANSDEDGYGEFYNSNPYNRYPENSYTPINARQPAPHTIKRGAVPYLVPEDSIELANKVKSPLPLTPEVLKNGQILFESYCEHCHGKTGAGDGPVNKAFKGVANLTSATSKEFTEGHIYYVITYGIRRMWSHASQVTPTERWEIAAYVKHVLQNPEPAQ